MRGRDGYDAFDAREYDERREYERHYERDRPHPERGKVITTLQNKVEHFEYHQCITIENINVVLTKA